MARNRRSQSAVKRFGPALKACLLCVLIGGSGVGYVWQKEQIAYLGKQQKERENRLRSLWDVNESFRKQLAHMRSPQFLEPRTKELGLIVPLQSQIIRLNEPTPSLPHPETLQQFAARNDRTLMNP